MAKPDALNVYCSTCGAEEGIECIKLWFLHPDNYLDAPACKIRPTRSACQRGGKS